MKNWEIRYIYIATRALYYKYMEVIAPLESALSQLRINFDLIGSVQAEENASVKAAFRTASIKSFEYVYELSIRLVRRRLEAAADSPQDIESMDFKPLLRAAAEKGLVDDPDAWYLYRQKRNITSHTYEITKALDVINAIPGFIVSVEALLKSLRG